MTGKIPLDSHGSKVFSLHFLGRKSPFSSVKVGPCNLPSSTTIAKTPAISEAELFFILLPLRPGEHMDGVLFGPFHGWVPKTTTACPIWTYMFSGWWINHAAMQWLPIPLVRESCCILQASSLPSTPPNIHNPKPHTKSLLRAPWIFRVYGINSYQFYLH